MSPANDMGPGPRVTDLALAAAVNVAVFGLAILIASREGGQDPRPPADVVPITLVSAGRPGDPAAAPGPAAKKKGRRRAEPQTPTEVSAPETAESNGESPSATSTGKPLPPRSSEATTDAATDGASEGVAEGTPDAGDAEGVDGPAGAGAEAEAGTGTADHGPLFDRAVGFYRARLVNWFATRFRVRGSGLPAEALTKHRATAEVEIGEDLTIASYRMVSADHPAFEAAAKKTLDAVVGQKLPPPPAAYPAAVQRRITVIFTCTQQTCD